MFLVSFRSDQIRLKGSGGQTNSMRILNKEGDGSLEDSSLGGLVVEGWGGRKERRQRESIHFFWLADFTESLFIFLFFYFFSWRRCVGSFCCGCCCVFLPVMCSSVFVLAVVFDFVLHLDWRVWAVLDSGWSRLWRRALYDVYSHDA